MPMTRMYRRRRPGRPIRRRRFVRRRPARRATGLVRRVAALVQRREHRETKWVSRNLGSLTTNCGITSVDVRPLLPDITQGTDDYQRIGNRINGKYLYLKGHIQFSEAWYASGATSALTARLMVLEQRNVKTTGDIDPSGGNRFDWNHLLDGRFGTSTASPYGGNYLDNETPINKDLFRVYADRKFRFNWTNRSSSSTSVIADGNNLTKKFVIRMKVPKGLTYDVATGNYPSNWAPFMVVGFVLDGAGPATPLPTFAPLEVTAMSTLYFQDD